MKSILVDSNLLLVLLLGHVRKDLVGKTKRTKQFEEKDWDLIYRFLAGFQEWVATPGILAEVSNLASLHGDLKEQFFRRFRLLITNSTLQEHYTPAEEVVQNETFLKFGLTDAAIVHIAQNREITILTADAPLYGLLTRLGVNAINFNHVREASYGYGSS